MKTVTVEEILAAGGTKAWAKKNDYHYTGFNKPIKMVKLTPKQWQKTTELLLQD